MATGRIGSTPVLRVRWSDQPAAGTTVLSGLDDNSVALVYDAGYEAVYRNGALLSRGNDYTATDGTTVTLLSATLAGDIIEIFANDLVPLTDAISKGQYTAKGALLSASAASTPGVVTVGANDTVLTADSSTATGLKWATPAAGGMTLLSTTSLSGATTTISSINQTYVNLQIFVSGVTNATGDGDFRIAPNGTTNITGSQRSNGGSTLGSSVDSYFFLTGPSKPTLRTEATNSWAITVFNYASTTSRKAYSANGQYYDDTSNFVPYSATGMINTGSAISSLVFSNSAGNLSTGTVLIYGVK